MENKLVSIVLPTFNGMEFIEKSIESVLDQTYKQFELIIVNDCSNDDTPLIIEKYAKKDSRIKVIHNKTNQKLPKSLNIGFKEAKGEFLTWTSDDNYYYKDALEKMVEYLKKNPNKVMVCCDYEIMDYNQTFRRVFTSGKFEDLLEYDSIGACFMYRAEVSHKIGGYSEKHFKVEDYEYWLRIGLQGEIGTINEVQYVYRMQKDSLTATQKSGEVFAKTEQLLLNYIPKYLKNFPNINLGIQSQIRFALANRKFDDILKLFANSSKNNKRNIYVFLRDIYFNIGDVNCSKIIYKIGFKYMIKFLIYKIGYRIKNLNNSEKYFKGQYEDLANC